MRAMSRLTVFKNFTENLATLSKCQERKVAAIITDEDLTQVYSIGINGGPKGLDDCLCIAEGKYGCIHAEINALIKCTEVSTRKVMFVTLSPCKQCAAAIINMPGGFSTVYYFEEWKDTTGLMLLRSAGIKAVRLWGF
jgi:dCMP deaminase